MNAKIKTIIASIFAGMLFIVGLLIGARGRDIKSGNRNIAIKPKTETTGTSDLASIKSDLDQAVSAITVITNDTNRAIEQINELRANNKRLENLADQLDELCNGVGDKKQNDQ